MHDEYGTICVRVARFLVPGKTEWQKYALAIILRYLFQCCSPTLYPLPVLDKYMAFDITARALGRGPSAQQAQQTYSKLVLV